MGATTILICTRCRQPGDDPSEPRAGSALLNAVRGAATGFADLRVVGVACMSGCRRACAAALLAQGKVGYLFGDLPADAEGAADLLAVAKSHAAQPDGYLPRSARPERLRTGILARLPPLQWTESGSTEAITWPG